MNLKEFVASEKYTIDKCKRMMKRRTAENKLIERFRKEQDKKEAKVTKAKPKKRKVTTKSKSK